MSDVGNAFRAGIVIVVGSIIAVAFFFASKKTALDDGNAVAYYALMTDASGINAKSLITVAGLQVGEIRNIGLQVVTRRELGAEALKPLVVEKPDPDGKLVEEEVAVDPDERIRVARVDMMVSKDIAVPLDTWVKKESLGVLGAKALFLELGRSTENVKPGGRIMNVRSLTGTDALLEQAQGIVADVRSITKKLDRDIGGITADIKGITGELNRFVNGDGDTMPLDELYKLVMTDLRKLSNTVEAAVRDANKLINSNDSEFNKLVANVQRITADLADLTSSSGGGSNSDGGPEQPGDIRATMTSVRQVADDLSVVTSQLRELLGDDEATTDGIKELKSTITELNRSLTSLSEVMGRVERGEGTVGRLLTDEKIADKVEAAVSGASDFVAGLTSLETHIDVGTWYAFQRGANTTTVSLKLQPKPDKFYLIEVADDGGRLERFTERDTDGTVTRTSIREEDNQLRFTAMFAKRFFDFLVLRAGLIETTGGVGANIFLLENRVELRSDLFNFRGPRDTLATDPALAWYMPRWRTVVKAQPIPHLYVSAGVDDLLNVYGPTGFTLYSPAAGYGFDYFLGVGLTFKDDDLRSILPFIPGG